MACYIIGEPNLAALVAADASALYARNVLDFLKLVIDKEDKFIIDREDEIVRATLLCHDGEAVAKHEKETHMEISHTIINLIIFVLAIYVGYHVVWTVTPALHTPLMAVTNAISAIIIVGAMLAAGLTEGRTRPDHGDDRGRPGGSERVRRLPGHPAHAGDVQEEGTQRLQGGHGPEGGCMNYISMNVVTLLYLVASVCFIQALKGLSSPSSARMGNTFGMAGMAIAAVTTVALIFKLQAEFAAAANGARGGMGFTLVLLGVVVGGAIGAYAAKKVEMTKMPELVAAMHSLIGLAAVCIAIAAVAEPWAFNIATRGSALPFGNRLELFIGTFVGAVTFSGSVIAFGKLSGKYKFRLFQGAPVRFAGQHILNLVIAIALIALGLVFCFSDAVEPAWTPFAIMAIAVVRAGRADHHPDRRRRHAGGGIDAQLLLGLGRGRHRLLAE